MELNVKLHNKSFLMGDFDSNIRDEGEMWRDVKGTICKEVTDNEGLRLLEYHAEKRLFITKSGFKH